MWKSPPVLHPAADSSSWLGSPVRLDEYKAIEALLVIDGEHGGGEEAAALPDLVLLLVSYLGVHYDGVRDRGVLRNGRFHSSSGALIVCPVFDSLHLAD